MQKEGEKGFLLPTSDPSLRVGHSISEQEEKDGVSARKGARGGCKQEPRYVHWKSDGPCSSGLLCALRLGKSHPTPCRCTQGVWHHARDHREVEQNHEAGTDWGVEVHQGRLLLILKGSLLEPDIDRQGTNLQAPVDLQVGGVQR